MTLNRSMRLALGLAIAIFFLWLILRQIKLEELTHVFATTRLEWVTAALLAFAVDYAGRIERWRLMLLRDNPSLKWRSCVGPLLISFAANNILPLRAGDLLRSFAFNSQVGASSGVVIATLIVERLLDLLMVLTLLGAALASFGMDAHLFSKAGCAVLLSGAAVILFILLYPNLLLPFVTALKKFATGLALKRSQRVCHEIDKTLVTLQHLAEGKTMIKLILWSLMAWSAEGCVFWFAALSLPPITNPLASWLALPVGTLATLLPSTPGYIGTFDYFTVRAMTELGNNTIAAAAYALMVHALLWLPPTLIGGVYALIHPIRARNKLQAARS